MRNFFLFFGFLIIILSLSSCTGIRNLSENQSISFSQNGELHFSDFQNFSRIEIYSEESEKSYTRKDLKADSSISISHNQFYKVKKFGEKNGREYLQEEYMIGIFDNEHDLPFVKYKDSYYRILKDNFGDESFLYGIINRTFPKEELQFSLIFRNEDSYYDIDYSGEYEKNIFFSSKLIIPIEITDLQANYVNTEISYKFSDREDFTAEINSPFVLKENSNGDGFIYPVCFNLKNPVITYNPDFISIKISSTEKYYPYSELWKMELTENDLNKRTFEMEINKTSKLSTRNKNAVILVSGHQGSVKNESDEFSHWRNEGRQWTWREMYSLIDEDSLLRNNFDYYEFITDTYFQTVQESGENLAHLISDGTLLEKYDNIFLIGHSLGALIIRYASATEISDNKKLGDYEQINKIITINGINHGSALQSASSILINIDKFENPGNSYSFYLPKFKDFGANFDSLVYLGYVLYFSELLDNDFKGNLLSSNFIEYFSNVLKEIISKYPLFVSILVETKNIDPFSCGRSAMYDNNDYIEEINENLFDGNDIFIQNQNLHEFNEEYEYLDKMLTVNSLIEGNIPLQKAYDDGYFNCFSIRLLDSLLKTFSSKNNEAEYLSDGISNYYSQRLSNETDEILVENLDHLQTMLSKEVLKEVLAKIKAYIM